MSRKVAIISSLVVLCALAILVLGCPPSVVQTRPPEPRVEHYGAPPYPEAVWIEGYWRHERGEWDWVQGHWERRPKPHAHWVPGRWEPREGGWVWIKGHWEYR
ncbi:MAG TPA: hypothetical protein VK551_05715 [Thermodesulfobacteriota bacterium]|jgi:hypothetical protein|nr:hypothetical protein [Thermodesulfobacteriota bacterium]